MEENKTQGRRYPTEIVVGIVVVLLALIGLFTVVTSCIHLGQRLLDNSREKEEFEQILFPVLMFDPAVVEDPSEMDDLVLLRSSIWATFLSNTEKYPIDSIGRISVAKSDVDVAAAKLFGPEIQLNHQSFSDYMNTYYYDELYETYLAPIDGSSILYTPQVEDIDHSGVIYTLRVGYLESGNEWMATLQGSDYEPTPDKYMIYTMKKVGDHFQLLSIQYPEDGAVPGKPVYQLPQSSDESLPTEDSSEPTEVPQEEENKDTI